MNKLLSFFTFAFISSLVLAGAHSIVDLSLAKDNNTVLIASLIKSTSEIAFANQPNTNQETAVLGVSTEVDTVSKPKNCPPSLTVSLGRNNSIVDFLNRNHLDYSFEGRILLAGKYGLSDYRGTADQNSKLMQLIVTDRTKCQE